MCCWNIFFLNSFSMLQFVSRKSLCVLIRAVVASSIHEGVNSWGLLLLLSVCLLFFSQWVQDVFPPAPTCTSVRKEGVGESWALGERQLNKQREQRGREMNQRREKPWVFFWICHVIWANPLISGHWLFGPSGCWISVTDEKKWARWDGIWSWPHAKDELAWERKSKRVEVWIGFGVAIWLADRHQKDQQTDGFQTF